MGTCLHGNEAVPRVEGDAIDEAGGEEADNKDCTQPGRVDLLLEKCLSLHIGTIRGTHLPFPEPVNARITRGLGSIGGRIGQGS